MVCVPCFIIPVLLYLFHRFVQPVIYGLWGEYLEEPIFTCPLPAKKKKPIADGNSSSAETASPGAEEVGDKTSLDAKIKSE